MRVEINGDIKAGFTARTVRGKDYLLITVRPFRSKFSLKRTLTRAFANFKSGFLKWEDRTERKQHTKKRS